MEYCGILNTHINGIGYNTAHEKTLLTWNRKYKLRLTSYLK